MDSRTTESESGKVELGTLSLSCLPEDSDSPESLEIHGPRAQRSRNMFTGVRGMLVVSPCGKDQAGYTG